MTIWTALILTSSSGIFAQSAGPLPGSADFVNVAQHIPGIVVSTPYATKSNFLKAAVYSQNAAYLRRAVADRLGRVQADLATQGYGLKVLDGYRPLSVQQAMWEIVPDPRYVADPVKGSRHNRGAAVDVTLVDGAGKDLVMPTAFDDFSEAAHVASPAPSEAAGRHRQILQDAMKKQGFAPLATEWWHFDSSDWSDYPVADVSFDEIDAGRGDELALVESLVRRVRELELEVERLQQCLSRLEPPASSGPLPQSAVELKGKAVGR